MNYTPRTHNPALRPEPPQPPTQATPRPRTHTPSELDHPAEEADGGGAEGGGQSGAYRSRRPARGVQLWSPDSSSTQELAAANKMTFIHTTGTPLEPSAAPRLVGGCKEGTCLGHLQQRWTGAPVGGWRLAWLVRVHLVPSPVGVDEGTASLALLKPQRQHTNHDPTRTPELQQPTVHPTPTHVTVVVWAAAVKGRPLHQGPGMPGRAARISATLVVPPAVAAELAV